MSSDEPQPPEPKLVLPTTPYSFNTLCPTLRRVYITDAATADREIASFTGPVCGLDTEWRPTYTKGAPENPVALLQLANADTILLLHLTYIKCIPPNLQTFLEDPAILKVGAGIQGDAQKLYKDWKVSLGGCVDLSLLARTVDNGRWKGKYSQPIGLQRMVAIYEDLLLHKGKVTRSNWEKHPLDAAQLEYASNDAHAGYTLYHRFFPMLDLLPKMPETRCFSFDTIRGSLVLPLTGTPWTPSNPDYDPGPPPPPKEKKDKKDKKKKAASSEAEGAGQHKGKEKDAPVGPISNSVSGASSSKPSATSNTAKISAGTGGNALPSSSRRKNTKEPQTTLAPGHGLPPKPLVAAQPAPRPRRVQRQAPSVPTPTHTNNASTSSAGTTAVPGQKRKRTRTKRNSAANKRAAADPASTPATAAT
ncbi:3'-5' exonuclease domain-containing protein [Mycena kentingensis (nom. inval.)]|nr:3'-5' exonuclease domain-containing protein [Mycena kentingensis (nom. inval.)]